MEGYSVTEAASVLGVPTERVWELLARGVLSGVPDGETGMRVFLQPRPAPPAVEEPRRSNGHPNARENDAEASPFRELLTEFRGLTERYGQALLALGEARGEVASLRSRVDVLEARMDLRLPYASPPSSDPAWAGPSRTSSEPRAPVSDHPDADVEGEHEGERSARRKRGRGHFSDEFADALARAEDPSPAVLRDAHRAAASADAVQSDPDEAIAEAAVADAGLPRELPPAETMTDVEPDAEPATAQAERVIPDEASEAEPMQEAEVELRASAELATEPPAAEPLAAEAPQAEGEMEPEPEHLEPEPVPPAEVAAETEPEPQLEAEAPPEIGPEPEPVAAGAHDAEAEIELLPEAEPVQPVAHVEAETPPAPAAVIEADAEPEHEADSESAEEDEPGMAAEVDELPEPEVEPSADPEAVAAAAAQDGSPPEPSWDQERYSTQIEEPDWWTPEESAWTEPEGASEPEPAESAPEEPGPARADFDEPAHSDAVAAPSPAGTEPAPPGADDERPSVDAVVPTASPVAVPEEVAIEGSGESYSGEETILWFGRQPASSVSEDARSDEAAGEMEVASTGRRGWMSPEDGSSGMPGAQELDEALASFDPRRELPAPTAAEPKEALTAPLPSPARPSTPPATTSEIPSVVSAELRGQASRAYRRLRRIFPS